MESTTSSGPDSEYRFREIKELKTPEEVEYFLQSKDLDWRRVGDQHNTGTAEMVEKPENALVKRETNMIDAVTEREAIEQYDDLETAKAELPDNPREAVSELLNLPAGGYDSVEQREVGSLSQRAVVSVVAGSSDDDRLTIDLRDRGIGQQPTDFPDTLLSLHGDNKNSLPFLIGSFGQGGSNSYPLSEYTLIVSRSHEGGDVGWTIVRENPRHVTDDGDEVRAYEYATEPDGSIPRVPLKQAPEFDNGGTLIRLIDFYATEFTGRADNKLKLNNVAGVTKKGLFASVYPIRVEDRRKDGNPHATIKGGRHLLNNSQYVDEVDGERTQGVIDVPTPHGDVEVRWWMIDPRQSKQSDTKRGIVGRFVNPTNPIVWTRSGQVHHEQDKHLFDRKGVNLGFVKDRMIVEVNADTLSTRVQESVFSSTRDRAIQDQEYNDIVDAIVEAFADDPELNRLNQHYHERAREGGDSAEDANDDLSELMSSFDIEANDIPGMDVPGGAGPLKEDEGNGSTESEPYVPEPVSDLKPEPTWVRVANPDADDETPITVDQGGTFTLHLEADAQDDFEGRDPVFDTELSEALTSEFTQKSRRKLKSGHTYITFDVSDDAPVGETGDLVTRIEWDEETLETNAEIEIVEPPEPDTDDDSGSVSPEIVPHEDDGTGPFSFGTESVVKYVENRDSRDEVHVALFNEHIEPILNQVTRSENVLNRYTREYMAHIAFKTTMEHHSDVEWEDEELRNKTRNQTAVALMQAIAKNVDPQDLT